MIRSRWPWCALFLVSGMLATAGVQAQPPASPGSATENSAAAAPAGPVLEERAINLLKAAGKRLASARSLSFTAVTFYENPSRSGQPLVYATKSEVLLQRPDKLRVITPGDGPASGFYYDGKTVTAFSPGENFVSIAAAPPTIDAALEEVYHSAAIYFPFTDMIVADPYRDIAEGLTRAFYIGQSGVVGGTTTDMVAYESDGALVQLWIGTDDRLPRMERAVFRNDPARLRHQVEFSNWKLDTTIPADAFASAAAASAVHIPFARPDALPVAPDAGTAPQNGPSNNR